MGSAHMTVGELSSFLMYAFWVGISIGGMHNKFTLNNNNNLNCYRRYLFRMRNTVEVLKFCIVRRK